MSEDTRCADCGTPAPELEESGTLRSTSGWRFMPEAQPDGRIVAKWHCPSCWKKKKEQRRT